MNNEGGFNPEAAKEAKLAELQGKIDQIAGELISTWNEDKGWALTLLSEGDSKYIQEQGEKVGQLNTVSDAVHEKKGALAGLQEKIFKFGKKKLEKEVAEGEKQKDVLAGELGMLDEKQKAAREKFETLKTALENLLTEYYFQVRGTGVESDWEKKFSYARVYHPSYHDLKTGQTSPEDKKRELADTKAYIYDFRKMFEVYGADIIKREVKN